MTDRTTLERRYRRWLSLYPRPFRAEHEEEMLAVLLDGAGPDRTRPRLGEATNLTAHGVAGRMRRGRLPGDWERAHARVMFPLRIAIGLWLAFLTAVLYGYGRGGWWAALLVPAMLLHFYIAYRIRPRQASTAR